MLEILRREQYREYEEFVSTHPRGEFMQSSHWQEVKNNWQWEAVGSRNEAGKIVRRPYPEDASFRHHLPLCPQGPCL